MGEIYFTLKGFFLAMMILIVVGTIIILAIKSNINELKKEKNKTEEIKAKTEEEKRKLNDILTKKKRTLPSLAKALSDYESKDADITAMLLALKNPAAPKASEIVKIYGARNKMLAEKSKQLEYQREAWLEMFPWLEFYNEVDLKKIEDISQYYKNNKDYLSYYKEENYYYSIKRWLTPEEYINLSITEKNQLALDRYISRKNKSNWEIGLDYERYIGFLMEVQGYKVNYNGAIAGKEDLGRDLIASKGLKTYVIQCKYWSENKKIYEKYILQLFGTVVLMRHEEHQYKGALQGMLITSAKLSDVAKYAAKVLGIKVKESVTMDINYPRIKCNINRKKEKIYHLPFDEYYDQCQIQNDGECYVRTIEEAESKGFRRAYKYSEKKQTDGSINSK